MSKTSYTLIAVMIAALIFMGAVRLHEVYEHKREIAEEASRNDGDLFSFQHIPVSLAGPQTQLPQAPVEYKPQGPVVYLEDTPLTPEQQQQQARDTIASILADFEQETALAGFNEEIQQASHGEIQGLEDLSTQNLNYLIQQNPQIKGVVVKHLKNPNFSKIIDEIFSNPQFQQSVQTLQQTDSAR